MEISEAGSLHIELHERNIPVEEEVQGACEMLGLDPMHVANEGRFAAFVPADQADRALWILRSHPLGAGACAIGHVESASRRGGLVTMRSRIGAARIVDMLSGEQLPRIC